VNLIANEIGTLKAHLEALRGGAAARAGKHFSNQFLEFSHRCRLDKQRNKRQKKDKRWERRAPAS
jgi:hypothetical protein